MADEALFQFLHNEVIQYVNTTESGETENGRCVSKLENMGFRVGQGLIERQPKTPPPPCWSHSLVCMGCPSTIHPPRHPSGPSSVARHSSMNKTVLKSVFRFTKDTARFKDELDVMKFICKDFWTCVFKKQIDNLRTNHQGIYVLQDNKFRLLTQLSAGKQYLENAPKYLAFPCGLVRGALSNLGVKSIVTAEVSVMPACKFQVMIQKM
ncbi:trafficking protein particle complex subunit 6b isoform X1 [Brachyhypopomus gauderio]|uniref:trafficking protein particle complex subunit 6b isoform X1 n=1 Tax=Brachyhypopomus gauderio TaxID=698409 RepID=UPI0040412E77